MQSVEGTVECRGVGIPHFAFYSLDPVRLVSQPIEDPFNQFFDGRGGVEAGVRLLVSGAAREIERLEPHAVGGQRATAVAWSTMSR